LSVIFIVLTCYCITYCDHVQVVGTGPLDVAAHLKLLGESLSVIGARLQEHKVTYRLLVFMTGIKLCES